MILGCSRIVTEALPSISRQTKSVLPAYNFQQLRSTVMVKRRTEPGLAKIGRNPKIRGRHLIYDFVENLNSTPLPPIQCILTENILGIGVKGELVTVPRKVFRNSLYPRMKAVYASPENLAEYESIEQEQTTIGKVTKFSMATSARLKWFELPVPMSGDNEWVLDKQHVRLALRRMGIEAEEGTITLLDDTISKPQKFQFQLSIMGAEPMTIDGQVYPVYKDRSKTQITDLPSGWKTPVKSAESVENESDSLNNDPSREKESLSVGSMHDSLNSDSSFDKGSHKVDPEDTDK